MKFLLPKNQSIALIIILVSFYSTVDAQVDSTRVSQADTLMVQSAQAAAPDTTAQEKEKKEKKDDGKRKDEFIPYVGVNFNQISDLDTDIGVGYHIGFNYKRGKFFYWQVGARFSNAVYKMTNAQDSTDNVSIRSIDIPVTGGINFLSFTNRVLALRLFVSAVPSFALGVGDNDLGFDKDVLEKFGLYGQAGVGVNVAFLVVEAGYNYGFTNVFTTVDSKPGQVFVNLGFRF